MNDDTNAEINNSANQDGINPSATNLASSQPSDPTEQSPQKPKLASRLPALMKKVVSLVLSWIIIPILIVLFVHNFIVQAFYVSGSSMIPTFNDGDYLVISKLGVTLNNIKLMLGSKNNVEVQRGDVIIFRYPPTPKIFFVKRIIGLPTERVVIKDGQVKIYNKQHPDGFVLDEKYIATNIVTQGSIDTVIEPDTFFVMGDNRNPNGSFDSRDWGTLPQKDIIGKAELRLLPLGKFTFIKDPNY